MNNDCLLRFPFPLPSSPPPGPPPPPLGLRSSFRSFLESSSLHGIVPSDLGVKMIGKKLTSIGLIIRPGSRRSWLAKSDLYVTISGDPTIYKLFKAAIDCECTRACKHWRRHVRNSNEQLNSARHYLQEREWWREWWKK